MRAGSAGFGRAWPGWSRAGDIVFDEKSPLLPFLLFAWPETLPGVEALVDAAVFGSVLFIWPSCC